MILLKQVSIARHFTTIILKNRLPEASGVFVKFKNQYFILSSAHQFWGNDKIHFEFVYKNENRSINGKDHYYMNKDIVNSKDLDFSLIDISEEVTNGILADLDFYELGEKTLQNTTNFRKNFLSGIRAQTAKFEPNGVTVKPFEYFPQSLTFPNDSAFFHFQYSRRNVFLNGIPSIGPIPKGCSGCGIWNFDCESPILVGILVEYDINKAHLIALKIPVVVEFIENHLQS